MPGSIGVARDVTLLAGALVRGEAADLNGIEWRGAIAIGDLGQTWRMRANSVLQRHALLYLAQIWLTDRSRSFRGSHQLLTDTVRAQRGY